MIDISQVDTKRKMSNDLKSFTSTDIDKAAQQVTSQVSNSVRNILHADGSSSIDTFLQKNSVNIKLEEKASPVIITKTASSMQTC